MHPPSAVVDSVLVASNVGTPWYEIVLLILAALGGGVAAVKAVVGAFAKKPRIRAEVHQCSYEVGSNGDSVRITAVVSIEHLRGQATQVKELLWDETRTPYFTAGPVPVEAET